MFGCAAGAPNLIPADRDGHSGSGRLIEDVADAHGATREEHQVGSRVVEPDVGGIDVGAGSTALQQEGQSEKTLIHDVPDSAPTNAQLRR